MTDILTLIGILLVIYQIRIQIIEQKRTGRLESLTNLRSVILGKIHYYEGIVDKMKADGKKRSDWQPSADIVNKELLPVLDVINKQIAIAVEKIDMLFPDEDVSTVDRALNRKG